MGEIDNSGELFVEGVSAKVDMHQANEPLFLHLTENHYAWFMSFQLMVLYEIASG